MKAKKIKSKAHFQCITKNLEAIRWKFKLIKNAKKSV